MSVSLVSLSQPYIRTKNNERYLTPEECIVYCARVSNPSNQLNTETSSKLLRYLIEHRHWSPLEMITMCVEIKTSRAIAAQILRHRSFSFQEYSQRYSKATTLENIEWRKQGKTNRQVGDEETDLTSQLKEEVNNTLNSCKELYDKLVSTGIAKECARMILPLATSTTILMSGSIRSWVHYLDIRTKEDTQKEHRQIALKIKDIFTEHFPNVYEALNNLHSSNV